MCANKYMKKYLILLAFILFLFPFIASAEYVEKLYIFIDNISTVLFVIAGGIALIVIVYGGISYMTSGGNEEQAKKAKKILIYGIIGAAIVFAAGFIIDLLIEFLAPLIS